MNHRKWAVITGASSGIGAEFAKQLSADGYDILLVARRQDRLLEVQNSLNGHSEILVCNLAEQQEVRQLTEWIWKNQPVLLINNAGFGDCGYFTKTDLEKEIKMIETNIIAYHVLTKLYLKEMKEKNSGKILNVASIAGFMPGPLMATYYATKSYIVRISEATREELRREKSKVQISILCPGPVDTNFNKVADVQFALKGLSSEYVGKYAVDKLLKGKFYIVPGWKIKLTKFASKFIPNNILAMFCFNIQKRKIK